MRARILIVANGFIQGTGMREFASVMTLLLSAAAVRAVEPPLFIDGNIRSTIRTLSSDAFGGRAPGSAGEKLTTDYIASQFKRDGLLPADRGNYLQEVPLVQITARADAVLTVSGGIKPLNLAHGSDVVVFTRRPYATVSLAASPLVFGGYGIVAPEYQWNDYAGVNVQGKTVVVLMSDPGYADPHLFRGKVVTHYFRSSYKYEEAARQGAAGVLIVHDTGPAAGIPWEVVRNSWTGAQLELAPGTSYRPQVQGWLNHEAADKLLAAAGLELEQLSAAAVHRGFKAVDLKLNASLTLHNDVQSIVSHNVVALVRGAQHPNEVVVYTAHWDHLGTKPGPAGKPEIFHGAIDNASGIAGLLELARVYAHDKRAPVRSVLFIATTCEEQGLLGAAFYASHPLVPLANTVADFNMDSMNVYGKTRDLTVRGQFMSTLDDDVKQTAQQQGLKLLPDAEPEKGYYFRADEFEFAKAGVPAISIEAGTDYLGQRSNWGLTRRRDYVSQRYHKPADVYEAAWDLAGMRQQLEVLYLTGRKLADGRDWPSWYSDGPFRAVRELQRPAAR
jgi:Zn-dependent M28 family amino/carboxypeptidase